MSRDLLVDPAHAAATPSSVPRFEESGERSHDPSPPRVCMVISSFRPRVGGAERITERLSVELARRGHDVVVFTRRYPGLSRHDSVDGVAIHRLGVPGTGKLGALTFAFHTLWVLALHFRNHEVVHAQNPDTPLLVGFFAKLLLGRRLFFTVHSAPEALFGRKRRTGSVRLRLSARLADGLVALTDEMARDLEARGVPSDRIHVISGGIDTAEFSSPSPTERGRCRARLGADDGTVVYLFVGRLVELKQVDLLLRAWALGPRSARRLLLIIGEGPEGDRLRSLARTLGLPDVRFEPFTGRVVAFLHAADVFVLPSRREGLSAALLEAMSTGLAVLVSDLSGNRSVVNDGRNGLVFPVGDAGALAAGLRKLEAPDLRRRLGSAAAREIRRGYSSRRHARLHRRLYDRARDPEAPLS